MGAEESKTSNYKDDRWKKEYKPGKDDAAYLASYNENNYSENLGNYSNVGNSNEPLKHKHRDKENYYTRTGRAKKDKNDRTHDRRYHSDDRLSGNRRYRDASPHRSRVRSNDQGSVLRKQEKTDRHKKESPRFNKNTSTEKKFREDKKRKSSPDSKSQSLERKKNNDKQNKDSSCLPKVTQVKRRKKKGSLEKNKQAHRSAPDLSNDEMSRVGAWLDQNNFLWPPEPPAWPPAFPFSYEILQETYSHTLPGGTSKPRPIVDGMGSPLGTVYPDGTFIPDESSLPENTRSSNELPPSFRYSMPPYHFPSFPYFFPAPMTHGFYQYKTMQPSRSYNKRDKLANRSRSHNHIDKISNEQQHVYQTGTTKGQKVRNKSSGTPDDSGLLQESVSSHPSSLTAQPAELYYSDIADTKNSIRPFASYKANLHISVDNVRHAPETDINILDESDTESDLSGDDSLTDSSCNDVELDSNDINFTTKKIKSSSSSIDCRSPAVHVFQPLSKHEVFIDDSPQKHSAKSSSKVNDNNTNKNESSSAPVVRLSERESIVATSFLIEGEKAFCLTKSKQPSPPFSQQKITSRKEKIVFKPAKPKGKKSSDTPDSSKNSGTWFGLTGSPPPIKASTNTSISSTKKKMFILPLDSASSSSSSFSFPISELKKKPRSQFPKNNSLEVKSTSANRNPSFSNTFPLKTVSSSAQDSPTPKPRLSKAVSLKHDLRLEDSVFLEPNNGLLFPNCNTKDNRLSKDLYESDSSNSEPLMRNEDHNVARKLVRIDSRNSNTMKRRIRYHRRSASLTDRVSRHESLEGRSAVTNTSLNVSRMKSSQELDPVSTSGNCIISDLGNSYRSSDIYVESLLHKAKSEELLKREMYQSNETLLSDFSPRTKKETLQQRAARILGLKAGDLDKAKQNQAVVHNASNKTADDSSFTIVTATSSARGSISHCSVFTPRSKEDQPEHDSFAVSVTESMLDRTYGKIKIKNVEHVSGENSSSDVSSITIDSVASKESSDLTRIPDAEYLIEVSDSVLEDTTVPCSVKPHTEAASHNKILEYKLPHDVLAQSEAISKAPLSPTSAQASIVANYASNIYERVPQSEISHTPELSDDTTETESLDHSARFAELMSKSRAAANGVTRSIISSTLKNVDQSLAKDRYIPDRFLDQSHDVETKLHIAPHSAPLTPGELDIIRQLYNTSDSTGFVDTIGHNEPTQGSQLSRNQSSVELQKEKIAKAIGFNVANLERASTTQEGLANSKLEKIEDFDIKLFPGTSSTSRKLGYCNKANINRNKLEISPTNPKNDLKEAMKSLNLDPEESWMVSI